MQKKNIKKFKKTLATMPVGIIAISLILMQFIFISIIFFQTKGLKNELIELNLSFITINNLQTEQLQKINTMQSNMMRLQSQLFRLQSVESPSQDN